MRDPEEQQTLNALTPGSPFHEDVKLCRVSMSSQCILLLVSFAMPVVQPLLTYVSNAFAPCKSKNHFSLGSEFAKELSPFSR